MPLSYKIDHGKKFATVQTTDPAAPWDSGGAGLGGEQEA